MIRALREKKDEYLGEKEDAEGAPRLPSVSTSERLLTDNRGDFPFGGHRLSSLYRTFEYGASPLTNRYLTTSFSLKYSLSTSAGVTAPGAGL